MSWHFDREFDPLAPMVMAKISLSKHHSSRTMERIDKKGKQKERDSSQTGLEKYSLQGSLKRISLYILIECEWDDRWKMHVLFSSTIY